MKYTITITQAHIDEAIKRSQYTNDVCSNCPIALAVREQIDPELRVTFENIYNKKTHKSYKLPTIGKQIASTHSTRWNELQPVSFEVEEEEVQEES